MIYSFIMKNQKVISIVVSRTDFENYYKVNQSSGCWEWSGTRARGYGRYQNFPAHRIAWMIYKGVDPVGFYVLHKCDNRSCVNPSHLYLGTQSDNIKDMWDRGRRKTNNGVKVHSFSKITKVRQMYKTGNYSLAELGRLHGMNRSMVYKIVNNTIRKNS